MTNEVGPTTCELTRDERARLVAALDHDARQLQHSTEMGLRTLRLIVSDLAAHRLHEESFDSLLRRMTAELACVQVAIRQVMAGQQELFDAVRFEFDQLKPVVRAIDADYVMELACKSNRGSAGDFAIRFASSRLTFLSDERWVLRILNNLIANAVWHSDGSRIFVCARRRGDDIVFEVRDNGRGMTAEKIAGVLSPMKAPPLSSSSQQSERSGLGLYSARGFTSRLGGSLDCVSAPGRGTRFLVRLPGPVAVGERPPRISQVPAAKAARNKMVVILDEDATSRRATERALESVGVEVYADHDPLRWLNVVTDLQRMPDLFLIGGEVRGHDCSAQIEIVRRKWRDQCPRVIVLTGKALDRTSARASKEFPILQTPLSNGDIEWLVGILASVGELPKAGLVCK